MEVKKPEPTKMLDDYSNLAHQDRLVWSVTDRWEVVQNSVLGITIAGGFILYQGNSSYPDPFPHYRSYALTQEERRELADFMMARWDAYGKGETNGKELATEA